MDQVQVEVASQETKDGDDQILKKFIQGLICGVILTMTTTAYASDTIQAYLFSVKYLFNGESKELDNEYVTLNHNGHAYVPVRWVSENLGGKVNYNNEEKKIYISTPTLASIPFKYPSEIAQKNRDVIFFAGSSGVNLEEFTNFIINVMLGEQDWVRITRYTIEADPIILQLVFDGNRIHFQYDTTRDAYGHKEIKESFCSEIVKEKNQTGNLFTYFLSGCDGNEERIPILRMN